ncbi:MAG TPA: GGDEF domain-containing protein, partial [Acidimicrobiales bacterium]|nr:GGDEF domain-containing protein [Acidimicrobiales bacterium]
GRSLVNDAVLGRRSLSLMVIDIDKLGAFNERHGHAAGDEVLRVVAARIRSAARVRDLPARLGGDEFVVLAHGIADEPTARAAGTRLHDAVTGPVEVARGAVVEVGASVGVAFTRAPCSADELIARADAALYEAKRGRGRVVVDSG